MSSEKHLFRKCSDVISASTWTSATTIDVERDVPRTTTSSPEDPSASKSSTSAQAVEERRERLGSGCTSSEPEEDPEPRASQVGRTDARHRTAATSTTGGTRPHTSGCSAAPLALSTVGTPGEGAGTVAVAAADEEDEDVDDSQTQSGRPTGASGTVTGAERSADGTVTPGGGAATSGRQPGDAEGVAAANGTSTSSPTESTPTGSGGKSCTRNRFTGATAAPEPPAA
ncbi:uncharacterized protein [Procambarus clarkii]|uniref:uncharacterized protein n=1 Tax=Procambarus clarkii TaxID=6728 RepID=UPI003742755E